MALILPFATVLFFFEGFSKIVLGEHDPKLRDGGVDSVLTWLEAAKKADGEKVKVVRLLNRFRNSWHDFGLYSKRDLDARGVELEKGKNVPVIDPATRLTLLADLLDVFLTVDDLRVRP